MKKIILLIVFAISGVNSTIAQELQPFKDGDRVAFLGNSITHAGFYESYIWLYYMTHFPDKELKILNAGSGGDVAGQMNARFEEDVLPMDPNIVVLTFGMNDSGYFEFWQDDAEKTAKERVEKSRRSFDSLQQKFKNNPDIKPVIMSSSPFDETADIEGSNNFSGKSKTLEEIVAFQKKAAEENNWAFVDLYYPMQEITQREQKNDSTYTITGPDRIHPGKAGHLVMAALFLKRQGLAGKPVAEVLVDAKRKKIIQSLNASSKIISASKSKIYFDYEANSLPFPIDSTSTIWNNPQKQSEALAVYPFIKEFNQEIIKVKNLEPGNYKLVIDGERIAQFSADSLSKGINLALLSNTPQYKQAKNVMFLNDQRAEIEGKLREYYWAQFNYFKDKDMLFEDSQKAYDMASEEKEGFIGSKMGVYRTARFPEVREMYEENLETLTSKIYEINKPKVRRVKIIQI